MTVTAEQERIKGFLADVEEIEDVAESLGRDDERRSRLLRVADSVLSTCDPIRVSVAAELLGLSQPTVRAWVEQGILSAARTDSPRLLLDPHRLHEVMHLITDLREAGTVRGLHEAVWHRLMDQALLGRSDMIDSLAQMGRGEGRVIDPEELLS